MKKIAILCFLLSNIYAYGQNLPIVKEDFSNNVIPENQKNINYHLKILKNQQVIYTSNVILKNSIITPLFYAENKLEDEDLEQKMKNTNDGNVSKIAEMKKLEDNNTIQLRVALHLSKENNNMWSNFFIQESFVSKKDEYLAGEVNLQNNNVKGIASNKNPKNKNIQEEFLISHNNGNEAMFVWNNYTFIFTGIIQ